MKNIEEMEKNRPKFPKRVVITGGMPYGNKDLHMGHIGAIFIHADVYARFLRDVIGQENVIFQTGTDGYGSPAEEKHRKLVEAGKFKGTIEDMVAGYHDSQIRVFDKYNISLNYFPMSCGGEAGEEHKKVSAEIFETLLKGGYLSKRESLQFFDEKVGKFLNGRQVQGRCPIVGCQSEEGYADECSLGHQYLPEELIDPISQLSGTKPILKNTYNYYFDLPKYREKLIALMEEWASLPETRGFMVKEMMEFLKDPMIFVDYRYLELVNKLDKKALKFELEENGEKRPMKMIFKNFEDREVVVPMLAASGVRFRTSKALVPLRITGDTAWGVPVPKVECDDKALTFYVWPESLWSPISFTRKYLETTGDARTFKDFWCDGSDDVEIVQFIGEDNMYFYCLAQNALFFALNECGWNLKTTTVIVNKHILLGNKKMSSSGALKPPTAEELLDKYTYEQVRAHFLGQALSNSQVEFKSKAFFPQMFQNEGDTFLKEGNLLTNVFNRIIRSVFYSVQTYYNGIVPNLEVSETVVNDAYATLLEFEKLIMNFEYHKSMNLLDTYFRAANKAWASNTKQAQDTSDERLRAQTIVDALQVIKAGIMMLHSIAPESSELVCEYLNIDKAVFNWKNIKASVFDFMSKDRKIKELPPKFDFFKKHPSQFEDTGN